MPGRDGTGPMGAGSMTGRGAGVCGCGVGRRSANFANSRRCGMGAGRGVASGRGMGLGRRSGAGVQVNPEDEKSFLEESIKVLEEELNARKKRIAEIG